MEEEKSAVEELIFINETLIEIVKKNLEKKEVPSKELLDTIKTICAITCALPME